MSVASTAFEYIFAGHGEHGALRTSLLYEPGEHDLQSLRPVPPKPALQGQYVLSYASCEPLRIASTITAMSAVEALV
jgi:hypothetical protein